MADSSRLRLVSLSPISAEVLRLMFPTGYDIEIDVVPQDTTSVDLKAAVRDADVVIGDKTHHLRLDRDTLSVMMRCRLIHQPAVGFDTIDHVAAADYGIPVANSAGFNSDAVADWTVMAILLLLRRAAVADRRMRQGGWPLREFIGHELQAMTVGIVGFGNAGRRVAERLRAFRPTLLHSEVGERPWTGSRQVTLPELLSNSSVVTLHVALDATTRGLVNREALGLMPQGSYLVNASRGAVVVERDLIEALASGRLAGAALDVYEEEPLPDTSPLRSLENVVLSPHVAGYTTESESRLLDMTVANVRRVLEGQPPINVVNGVPSARF